MSVDFCNGEPREEDCHHRRCQHGLQGSREGVEKKVMDREKPMISCLPKATRADCSIEKNILFCWRHCAWQGSAYTTHRSVGHHRTLFCCLWSINGITGGGAETGWKLMNPHNFHNSLSAPTLGFIVWRGFTNRIIPVIDAFIHSCETHPNLSYTFGRPSRQCDAYWTGNYPIPHQNSTV